MDGILVNKSEASRQLGISRPYLTKLINRGTIKLYDGKVDLLEAAREIPDPKEKTNGNGKANGTKEKSKQLTLFDEQARLTRIKADIADLELKEREGKMVDADFALFEFGKFCDAVRKRILATPSKCAPRCAHKTAAVVNQLMESELHKALNEFGKYSPEAGNCRPKKNNKRPRSSRKPAKSAKKSKRKRLGKR